MPRHPSSNPQPRGGDDEPRATISNTPGLLIYQSPDGTSRIHVRLD